MNAASTLFRVIAILGAIGAGALWYLTDQDLQQKTSDISKLQTDLGTAITQLSEAKTAAAEAEAQLNSQLAQARSQVADKDSQIMELQAQVTSVTTRANTAEQSLRQNQAQMAVQAQDIAQLGALRTQVATLQAQNRELSEQLTSSGITPNPSTTPSSGPAETTPGATTPSSSSVAAIPPISTTIVEANLRSGLIVIGAGSSSGVTANTSFTVNKLGMTIGRITIAETQPGFSVANIQQGSIVSQLSKDAEIELVQIR